MKRSARPTILILASIVSFGMVVLYVFGRGYWYPIYMKIAGKRTVAEVIADVGVDARGRMSAAFAESSVSYPPERVTLLATKDTAKLEVWVDSDASPQLVMSYDIKALSGKAGPKLREGDRQVPEGIYRIEALNPNSSFHLSMKLNYPNAFDLEHAQAEGRMEPGTNIFIHGKALSIGCLAMGDETIEELFVLTHDVGKENVRVVIAPSDPRSAGLRAVGQPAWVTELYRAIENEFRRYVSPHLEVSR
ncbi:MAG: L,D-transpeptidase family protein [Pseudomonadota bacterium]